MTAPFLTQTQITALATLEKLTHNAEPDSTAYLTYEIGLLIAGPSLIAMAQHALDTHEKLEHVLSRIEDASETTKLLTYEEALVALEKTAELKVAVTLLERIRDAAVKWHGCATTTNLERLSLAVSEYMATYTPAVDTKPTL